MRPLAFAALSVTLAIGCSAGSSVNHTPAPAGRASSGPRYVVDTVATGLKNPWSLAFLPDGGMIVTEKYGGIRHYRKGSREYRELEGAPPSLQKADGGLLDLALDPRFSENRLVYLSFMDRDSGANHTALFRAG
jgi:aldose sugar dehydrogenase